MAQIIDKIIRQSQAPNSTNVMWDNDEQLFINRNGSWQSVGGSSNGGSDVVTKAVDLALIEDNSYTKKLYDFIKTSYINGIPVNYVLSEGPFVLPPLIPGGAASFSMQYDEESDLVYFMYVEELYDSFAIASAAFGPPTDYNFIFENILGSDSTIIAGTYYVELLTTEGSVNNNLSSSYIVAHYLLHDITYYSPEYGCKLNSSTYWLQERVCFFGFTEDNKILKIEVDITSDKTISSTLFDLNSLITTA